MKNPVSDSLNKQKNRFLLPGFIEAKIENLRQREFTCPFCREVFKGISAFFAHLKCHCT